MCHNNRSGPVFLDTVYIVPFESLSAVSYSPSIVTMALSCIIYEIKRDTHWSKIVIFFIPLYIRCPVRGGGAPRNIAIPFGVKKTRMVGLPDGEKKLTICLAVLTEYRRVTDGRTDRQTDILPRHSPRYTYASRGN